MSDSDLTTRREFLKQTLLGLGTAAIIPPFTGDWFTQKQKYYEQWQNINPLPDDKKLNIALVGLGSYASGQLAPALQETKLCKLNGIVTGTPAKEDRWANRYNIPQENIYNYDTYDRIADNDDIDIIYIVLPNAMHAEYTIRGVRAGKHMISEKPMATSVKDARAMVNACEEAGKKFSVGYRLHFEPYNQEMMRIGQNQIFGPIQQIKGANGFTIHDPSRWRLDKKMAGGGPLMDMGIYAVQGAIYTMGKLPLSVTANAIQGSGKLFREVEKTINWELQFPKGITAKGMSSYAQNVSSHYVKERDGWAKLEPAFGYGGLQGKTSDGPMNYPQVNQQTLQMDAFADCILNDHPSRVPGEMGLRDVKILMAIYEAADTGKKVQFDWPESTPLDLV